MEKERRITAPEGCEIEKVEIVDGVAVVTFKEKKKKLPESWEEFCEMFDVNDAECYIDDFGRICNALDSKMGTSRHPEADKNWLPDSVTAEAVLALCQLIQLRDCYNGDWVPDWGKLKEGNPIISLFCGEFERDSVARVGSMFYFKSADLRDEFLRNFRPLIEKLKPIYGIKEGGEE